jgi:hypothetical protein
MRIRGNPLEKALRLVQGKIWILFMGFEKNVPPDGENAQSWSRWCRTWMRKTEYATRVSVHGKNPKQSVVSLDESD